MVKDGYEDIANMDISSVVIEQMKEKHMDIPQLTCTVLPTTPFS
jgi:RAT1-interacting protein